VRGGVTTFSSAGMRFVLFTRWTSPPPGVLAERGVPAGEVAPAGRLGGSPTSRDGTLLRAVRAFGRKAQVRDVDLRIVGTAQVDLQSRRWDGGENREARKAVANAFADRPCRAIHLFIQAAHGEGDPSRWRV